MDPQQLLSIFKSVLPVEDHSVFETQECMECINAINAIMGELLTEYPTPPTDDNAKKVCSARFSNILDANEVFQKPVGATIKPIVRQMISAFIEQPAINAVRKEVFNICNDNITNENERSAMIDTMADVFDKVEDEFRNNPST